VGKIESIVLAFTVY